jgi:hypothetical protein
MEMLFEHTPCGHTVVPSMLTLRVPQLLIWMPCSSAAVDDAVKR